MGPGSLKVNVMSRMQALIPKTPSVEIAIDDPVGVPSSKSASVDIPQPAGVKVTNCVGNSRLGLNGSVVPQSPIDVTSASTLGALLLRVTLSVGWYGAALAPSPANSSAPTASASRDGTARLRSLQTLLIEKPPSWLKRATVGRLGEKIDLDTPPSSHGRRPGYKPRRLLPTVASNNTSAPIIVKGCCVAKRRKIERIFMCQKTGLDGTVFEVGDLPLLRRAL